MLAAVEAAIRRAGRSEVRRRDDTDELPAADAAGDATAPLESSRSKETERRPVLPAPPPPPRPLSTEALRVGVAMRSAPVARDTDVSGGAAAVSLNGPTGVAAEYSNAGRPLLPPPLAPMLLPPPQILQPQPLPLLLLLHRCRYRCGCRYRYRASYR